jgi:hypothetical protein
MDIPKNIINFYQIIADEEGKSVEEVIVDVLRRYRDKIKGVVAQDIDEYNGIMPYYTPQYKDENGGN